MKVYKELKELALAINKSLYEVEEALKIWKYKNYMYIGEVEVMKHIVNNKLHLVIFDIEDNDDCKKYMMEYEIHEYTWKVYLNDVKGWQNCSVIDIDNTRLGINRATVICENGIKLNRVVKFVLDEDDEDFKEDGCVYYMEEE